MVVAETLEQATDAASRVQVTYEEEPAETDLRHALDDALLRQSRVGKTDYARGDAAEALAAAPVRIEQEYATPAADEQSARSLRHRRRLGRRPAHALRRQPVHAERREIGGPCAGSLGRRRAGASPPFVGGGFGAGLRAWPHTWLAALAAREVGRPVKLVLTARADVHGGRPPRADRAAHGPRRRAGRPLVAIVHHATHDTSRDEDFVEALTLLRARSTPAPMWRRRTPSRDSTARRRPICAARANRKRSSPWRARWTSWRTPWTWTRSPCACATTPERDPKPTTAPGRARSLGACYARGAELFDWARRTPEPGSMRDGNVLIGLGTATATYPAFTLPASAEARIDADGIATVRSAATDIGPGTYTALAQVAADALGRAPGARPHRVGRFRVPQVTAAGRFGHHGQRRLGGCRSVCRAAALGHRHRRRR